MREQYRSLDGPALGREVERLLASYELEESDFTLGLERFRRLRPRPAAAR